nr:MAG TPA: Integrin alpha-IIb, Integrin beta-3, transmembrane signaling, protein structure [Caudoviricetes sp.]
MIIVYSLWFVVVSILLGLVVSLALSFIILKLIYKVYKNIL